MWTERSEEDLRMIVRNKLASRTDVVERAAFGDTPGLNWAINQILIMVYQETKGSANPVLVNNLVKEELSKYAPQVSTL